MENMLCHFGAKMLKKDKIQKELYANFRDLVICLDKGDLNEEAVHTFASKCSAALLVSARHSLTWYEEVDRLWGIFLNLLDGHYLESQTFDSSVVDERVCKYILHWYQESLESSSVTKSRVSVFSEGFFTSYTRCPKAYHKELGRYVSPLAN